MQLVNHGKDRDASQTDLWVRFDNNAISNIALLIAKTGSAQLPRGVGID
jgi:hypothetical protein